LEALAVIWRPISTLARVADERRVLLGFGIVALYAALRLVVTVVDVLGGVTASTFDPNDFPDLPPEFVEGFSQGGEVGTLIYAVLSPFVGWVVVSLLMHLVTRFFGGTGPLSGMFAIVGVAAVPLVIVTLVEIPVTVLQAILYPASAAATLLSLLVLLLIFGAYAWNVALIVIGAAFARRVGYGQSAGSCAISCGGCLGLILIVGAVFGLLVYVLVVTTSAGPS
jgi:Yip1-like protein